MLLPFYHLLIIYKIYFIKNNSLLIADKKTQEFKSIHKNLKILITKSYNPKTQNYTLTFPNLDVKNAFLKHIASAITKKSISTISPIVVKLQETLENNNLNLFFDILYTFFAGFPYALDVEKNWQAAVYVILTLIGANIIPEDPTNKGRIDATIETNTHIYIIEMKVNYSADIALKQILKNKYFEKFKMKNKKIIIIGVNFDPKERNISEWKFQEIK